MQMVYDGEVTDASQIEAIKDDVDYYVESNGDEDFYEDDGTYVGLVGNLCCKFEKVVF